MTRFARAKGSKGSNERVPEQATPWSVMKQQFLNVRRLNYSVEGKPTNTTQIDKARGSNEWVAQPATSWPETNRKFLNGRGENSAVEGEDEINHNKLFRNEKQVSTVWDDFGGIKKNKNVDVSKNVSVISKNIKKLKNKKKIGATSISSVKDYDCKAFHVLSQAPVSAKSGNFEVRKKKKKDTGLKIERSENIEEFQSLAPIAHEDDDKGLEDRKKRKSKKDKTLKHNVGNELLVSANDCPDSMVIENDAKAMGDGNKKKSKKNKTIKHSSGNEFSVSLNYHPDSMIIENESKAMGNRKKSKKKKTVKNDFDNEFSVSVNDSSDTIKDGAKKNKTNKPNFGNEFSFSADSNPDSRILEGDTKAVKGGIQKNRNFVGESSFSANKNPDTIISEGYTETVEDGIQKNKIKRKFGDRFLFSPNGYHDYPDTMIIGGHIVEIGEFQGFPVKKEDEVRLKALRKELLAKGISRKEIEYVLKGERRRAEKALAREKKVACFNCRNFGHNVAECPELGDQTAVGKVCFKCGSTEHKYIDCKVVPEKDAFRFAECFICKEQGHISRQCPDNPRGLYPKGGACKVCGNVTHLKKDCPDLVIGKEKNTITIGTVDQSSILEALDDETTARNIQHKKKKKIVKF